MKKNIFLLLFIAISYFNTQAQYTPDYSVVNKGIPVYTGAVDPTYICFGVNNGSDPSLCSLYDVSGMNWTFTGTTTDPFEWRYANASLMTDRPFANTFTGNKFRTRRTFGDICMTSPILDIAGLGTVTINMAVSRIGAGTYLSAGDDVEFKYILNGGAVVSSGTLGSTSGSLGSGTISSWTTTVTGNTLQIFACMAQNSANEDYELTQFSTNKGVVLPITLAGFFANRTKDNEVKVTWQTAMEKNNAYFDIERSEDGKEFRSIGQVKGKGNTSSGFNYSFTDEKPVQGNNYYRLKQTDYDGSFEYSHILTVKNSVKQERFALSPNPVSEFLNVEYLGKNNDTRTIAIYDILGNLIAETSSDQQEFQISTSNLQSGTYILKINQNEKIYTEKFMKM
jgi:hypothetical protein